MAHDVFISYSAHDKPAADAVCAKLESRGIRCWTAPRDIRPGMSWGAAIVEAIDGARVMLLLFSSHANGSPQVKREVERAVQQEIVIVPVKVGDVTATGDFAYFLGTPHWLDAIAPPFEQHLDRIVDSTKYWLDRIKSSPPSPTLEAPTLRPTPLPTQPQPARAKPSAAPPAAAIVHQRIRPKWIVPAIFILLIAILGTFAFLATRYYVAQQEPGGERNAEQVAAADSAQPATSGPASSPMLSPAAETSPAGAPSTAEESAPPSGFCNATAPTLGTKPVTIPSVPTKPCGSDVGQCVSDLDSCLSRARRLDAEAAAQLGYLYMNGLGVERNSMLARNWSYLAATKGNPLGQDTMGELYKLGEGGVSQDYQQAQDFFLKAAAQDCALAENDLGDLNLHDEGVTRNVSEAFKWYKKAADRGDAMGQNNLGYMYVRGFGVDKDLSAAQDWYVKSAKQGNPFAQDALGYMYQTGLGVKEDPAQAFQCYKTAAEQGYVTAQIHLAEMYKKGVGVGQNSTEAARWYCKASNMGNIEANLQVRSMGADCSSLPIASAESSTAVDAASSPAASADPADDHSVSDLVRKIFNQTRHGVIDSTLLTEEMSEVIRSQMPTVMNNFAALGDLKELVFQGKSSENGGTRYTYLGSFTGGERHISIFIDAEGKVAGYKIGP